MEPTEKEIQEKSEEKRKERENDIFLQDYLKFKKQFIKITSILGVKFSKKNTSYELRCKHNQKR